MLRTGRLRGRVQGAHRIVRKMSKSLPRRAGDVVSRHIRSLQYVGMEFMPTFVCGVMGSGTTVVCYKLYEVLKFGGMVSESALRINDRSSLHMMPSERYASVEDYERSLYARDDAKVDVDRRMLCKIYRRCLEQRSPLVLDKAANVHLARMDDLSRMFESASFVVVLRDPAANVEGILRKWGLFGQEGLERAVDFCRMLYRRGRINVEALRESGRKVYVVRYEDFVVDPDGLCMQIGRSMVLPARRIPYSFTTERDNAPGKGIRNIRGGEVQVVGGANEEALRRMGEHTADVVRQGLADEWQKWSKMIS